MLIPLVARAGVLAEVGSVLTAARTLRRALLTFTCEPGIGKTRLTESHRYWPTDSSSSGLTAPRLPVTPRCARSRVCCES